MLEDSKNSGMVCGRENYSLLSWKYVLSTGTGDHGLIEQYQSENVKTVFMYKTVEQP